VLKILLNLSLAANFSSLVYRYRIMRMADMLVHIFSQQLSAVDTYLTTYLLATTMTENLENGDYQLAFDVHGFYHSPSLYAVARLSVCRL